MLMNCTPKVFSNFWGAVNYDTAIIRWCVLSLLRPQATGISRFLRQPRNRPSRG